MDDISAVERLVADFVEPSLAALVGVDHVCVERCGPACFSGNYRGVSFALRVRASDRLTGAVVVEVLHTLGRARDFSARAIATMDRAASRGRVVVRGDAVVFRVALLGDDVGPTTVQYLLDAVEHEAKRGHYFDARAVLRRTDPSGLPPRGGASFLGPRRSG